tara:strand:+ start:296 stop:691 length:396 start_codon:yes stop_codon:yes gene_type:complete
MKKVRGYIFSRPFMGERAPQHVQNIIIRDFCKKNSLHYLLSTTEYKMKNSFLMLKNLISDMKNIDGIVAYSLFQLPENYEYRTEVLKKIIKKKKFIFFAVEQMKISNFQDIVRINKIWGIKTVIPSCPKQI